MYGMSGILKSMLVSGWSRIWVGGNGKGPGFLSTSPDRSIRVYIYVIFGFLKCVCVLLVFVCVELCFCIFCIFWFCC